MAGHRRRNRPDTALQASARAGNRTADFDARYASAPDPVARLRVVTDRVCGMLRRLPEADSVREAERAATELLKLAERLDRKERS